MGDVRRKDYEMAERAEMERLLETVEYGFLGAVRPDGWPIVVPLNFVYTNDRIYFHGALEGEKMETFAHDDRVTFTVVEAFSLVPSYFRDPKFACPATQYYKSVVLRGRARVVEGAEEKALALQSMMEKLQPEGGHVPIRADEPIYRKSLRTTGVVAIEIERMTAKFKFGQNLPSAKRDEVAAKLETRGCPVDHATVDAMRRYNR